ncbi:hypothetical protein VTI74DRAFT_2458 [Chaetomium olivicolor]
MEIPKPDPAAGFTFGEGDAGSPWDPACSNYLFPNSFVSPDSSQHANAAANPSPDSAIGPLNCGSQAAGLTRARSTIDSICGPVFHADPRGPLPVAVIQTGGSVPSTSAALLAKLARFYEANASHGFSNNRLSNPSTPSLPPQLLQDPSVTSYLPGIVAARSSSPSPLYSSQSAPYPLPPRTVESLVDAGFLAGSGLPNGLSINHAIPFSGPLPAWGTSASPALGQNLNGNSFPTSRRDLDNTHFDQFKNPNSDAGSASFLNIPGSSQLSGDNYAFSPSSPLFGGAVISGHGRGGCRTSGDATATTPVIPGPSPERLKKHKERTASPSPLAIVQYKPSGDNKIASSRKRPCFEETVPQGISSGVLRQVSYKDEHGKIKATVTTYGKRVRKRSPFNEEKRQHAALARKEGVCSRCKRSKRECDLARKASLYESCTLCTTTKTYKGVARVPCFKVTLLHISFFRSRPAPNEPFFTKRSTVFDLRDLSKPDVDVRTLQLTQHVGSHHLTVHVAEFIPLPGDVVSYKWHDDAGGIHELQMPPFCLTNIEKIRSHFCEYIAAAKLSYLEALKSDDELAWMTVSASMEYAKSRPGSLTADALNLWAISRMIEIPWEIYRTDKLRISPVDDTSSPHHGKIPIPPIMDTQLDQILIQHILTPLRAKVVEKFEDLINPVKPEVWFDIYLSAFILLNHIERLAKHSVEHAKTHTMPRKYSNISFLEDVFHTAKSILARFHFVCNGSSLLSLDWTAPKTKAVARLIPEEIRFMQRTQDVARRRVNDVRRLRDTSLYETTLYWSGQMFLEDFDTSPVRVVDVVNGEEEKGAVVGPMEFGVKRKGL